jgi:hypothetical protein
LTLTPGRGPVINDGDLLVAAACAGFDIFYILGNLVAAPIGDGHLTRLPKPWYKPVAGDHLYLPRATGHDSL